MEKEEIIYVGDGEHREFRIPLENSYKGSCRLFWYYSINGSYLRVKEQDGDVITENGKDYLIAAFAGIPSESQFKVVIQGIATSNAPEIDYRKAYKSWEDVEGIADGNKTPSEAQ